MSEAAEETQFQQAAAAELCQLEDTHAASETSKLKQLFAVLKKTVGVKDLAALRLSLPANLLHPEGNLEYWHYLDRPDVFAAIADSNDDFHRMLAVLRWMFTKDLKVIKGKVCKPYNSVLGEQFRAIWDVYPSTLENGTGKPRYSHGIDTNAPESISLPDTQPTSSSASSIKSAPASPLISAAKSTAGSSSSSLVSSTSRNTTTANESTPGTSLDQTSVRNQDSENVSSLPRQPTKARVVFLNEQCSHHPPVSTFWYESLPPEGSTSQRVIAYGVDQLSAKFTGTSVKVYAGAQNFGIYVKLPDRSNEEYHLTHPTANITGFLRGNPYVTVSDFAYVTCSSPRGVSKKGTKALRAILYFPEESWIGKARFVVEGIIYEYEIGSDSATYTKIKQVPESSIKAWLDGSWRGKVMIRTTKNGKPTVLLDLNEILPLPKTVRPTDIQDSYESRKLWQSVTQAIHNKQFSQATKNKQTIEQQQRDLAAERLKTGQEHQVVLFNDAARFEAGRPALSEHGLKVLKDELEGKEYDPMDIPSELLEQLSLAS